MLVLNLGLSLDVSLKTAWIQKSWPWLWSWIPWSWLWHWRPIPWPWHWNWLSSWPWNFKANDKAKD